MSSKEKLLKLNLGCGFHAYPGWLNVDKQESCDPDMQVDLEETPWPWDENSVGEVRLIHTLEHLGSDPRVFVSVMKELYRVCRHGAHIHIVASHPRHESFLCDPTATRPVTVSSMQYFDKQINNEWKARGSTNTPLALYEDFDFRLVNFKLILDENFTRHAMAKKWNNRDLRTNINLYNNAIAATEIHLVVVKDKEDARFALATPLNLEPFLMYVHQDLNRDRLVSASIAQSGQWEATESTVVSKVVTKLAADKKRFSVMNLGANIGWYALLCARASANVVVDAYEPVPENVAIFKKSVELNGFDDRINVNELAISDKDETLELTLAPQSPALARLKPIEEIKDATKIQVKADCLDNIFKGKKLTTMPELLIMDVAGCEQKVLNGASKVFERGWRPIIFTKFSPAALNAIGEEFTMFKKLAELKYQFFVISPSALNLSPLTLAQIDKYYVDLNKPKARDRYLNIVAIPEGVDVKALIA